MISPASDNQYRRQRTDTAVRVEQVRLLYGSPIIVLINPINASIVAILLWQMYPAVFVLAWIGLFVVVIGARAFLSYRFRSRQQPVQDPGRWGRRFAMGAFVTGCLWGLLVSIIFVTDDPVYYVFVLFVLGGMTAGSAMQSSAYLPAFYGFAAPTLLPMIILLVAKEGAHSAAMALLLTTFAAILLIMGRDNNRRITENIRLRIEQTALNEELRRHEQDMMAIARLSDMLQSCHSRTEAYPIIALTANNVFRGASGALALVENGTHALKTVVQWGADQLMSPQFLADDCWALRTGQSYEVNGAGSQAGCQHFKSVAPGSYVCLPLIVHGETSGLLHLNTAAGDILTGELHRQMLSFGDVVKLSLSNLKLRESLIEQAMRDQLTGLFNRYYLVETLPREIKRAQRNNAPLSIAMLDIDHFKMFNDTQGHDAGDLILKELGALLRESLRAGDIACRYGGEEFLLLLPECDLSAALTLLQQICLKIKRKSFQFQNHTLPTVKMSAGISQLDHDLASQDTLIRAADEALYTAKRNGRDRIEIFSNKIRVLGRIPAALIK